MARKSSPRDAAQRELLARRSARACRPPPARCCRRRARRRSRASTGCARGGHRPATRRPGTPWTAPRRPPSRRATARRRGRQRRAPGRAASAAIRHTEGSVLFATNTWAMAGRGRVILAAVVLAACWSPVRPCVPLKDDGVIPEPGVPILNEPVARGGATVTPAEPIAPTPKTVDGEILDWTGRGTGFGGTVVRSAGEVVYRTTSSTPTAPTDGDDADRLAGSGRCRRRWPRRTGSSSWPSRTSRESSACPRPTRSSGNEQYGDPTRADAADLLEIRVGVRRPTSLWLLARTTTMTTPRPTRRPRAGRHRRRDRRRRACRRLRHRAALGGRGCARSSWPDDRGGRRSGDRRGQRAARRLRGHATPLAGRTRSRPSSRGRCSGRRAAPRRWRRDRSVAGGRPRRVANVAFRTAEPVRTWFDKQQALALRAGSIDEFLLSVDLDSLHGGATEHLDAWPRVPRPRLTLVGADLARARRRRASTSTTACTCPRPTAPASPGRCSCGCTGAAATPTPPAPSSPGCSRTSARTGRRSSSHRADAARRRGTSARATSTSSEVWADALARFPIDEDRVYVTGHSMGGWGSYLLTRALPRPLRRRHAGCRSRDAGSVDRPRLRRAATTSLRRVHALLHRTNDGRPRDQHTRRLLENLRNVPVAILQGAIDELVPVERRDPPGRAARRARLPPPVLRVPDLRALHAPGRRRVGRRHR